MILLGDSAKVLKDFNDESIDLTVTSPPYDDLRSYGGYSFDFQIIAKELYRVTKQGGVIVWVIGDRTDKTESGTSFRQALYFMDIGFYLHDTMIYSKSGFSKPSHNRYHQVFEYMFVLSKGKPKTFNPIRDRVSKNKFHKGEGLRRKHGRMEYRDKIIKYNKIGMRYNIWQYSGAYMNGTSDKIAYQHPAIFPEQLAEDHIRSWSNEGDLILDPFLGSGTTYKMALKLNRKPIGIEINPNYIKIVKERLII